MDKKLQDKLQNTAGNHIANLLEENWPAVIEAMAASYAKFDGSEGAKFNYDVALKVRLTPKSGDFGISASISYGTRIKCDTAQQVVSAQGELFEADGGDE